MLNRWRYVDYLDDGVCGYQCLKCYLHFSTRDYVGYRDHETHECTYYWHFCPNCGTKWDGCHRWEGEYGPRRQRIEDAIKRRDDDRARRLREEPYTWVMERNYKVYWGQNSESPDHWERYFSWPSTNTAHQVYEHYKDIKRLDLADHQEDIDDGEATIEYRLRLVRMA